MLTRINYLTAGESHGKGLLGIIEGIPAGLDLTEEFIEGNLYRRQQGYGRGGRMKIEKDRAEIYCGVRNGKTIGSPIGLILPNKDWKNWEGKMNISKITTSKKITLPRPGHADLAGIKKFNFSDIRDVIERSSARETAMRVALASICRKLLNEVGIEVYSRVIKIHSVIDKTEWSIKDNMKKINKIIDNSPVRCLGKNAEKKMMSVIDKAKSKGDSVGGVFEIIAIGMPYGLGSYTQWYKKLQSRITHSIMSINAFKGIEIGSGFNQADHFGSQVHDEIGWDGNKYIRYSNNSGGIEGGMSNAQPLVIRTMMKPIPTLIKPLRSIDISTKEKKMAHKERSDTCSVPAASIIAENILCFDLADSILEKFGGDSISELKTHMKASAQY